MDALTKEAVKKARKTVADTFSLPDSLDGLGVLSFQLGNTIPDWVGLRIDMG